MKVFALAIAVAMSVAVAHADSVDPGIIIRDPVGCPSNNCVSVTGFTFGWTVPSAGHGVLHFLNASGVTWTSLIITETGVPAINVSCSSDVFSCSVLALGQSGAKIVLTAINGLPGILSGHSFEIILGCKHDRC